MLQFKNFQKGFNSSLILTIPNLSIKEGVYWLQGENGAGKTTLIKSIAGLIPFTGTILVNETDIRKQRKRYRRLVNWADAEPIYPDFLTGNDLIAFYQQTLNTNSTQITYLVNAFSAGNYMHQKVSTYSSGMAKKLSLILSFMGEPKWIVLDEPLITLDVKAVDSCLSLISAYQKKGVSFIISSHQSFIEQAYITPSILTIQNKTLVIE